METGKRGNLEEDLAGGDEFAEPTMQRVDFVVALAEPLLDAARNVLLLHPLFVAVHVEHSVRHLLVVALHFAWGNQSSQALL